MNIFKYEMKQNIKSIIIWSISFFAITLAFTPFVSTFLEESEMFTSFINNFPEAFRKGMNLNPDLFFSSIGFFSYIFTYITLMAAIHGMNIGLNSISKENRMNTADFLMTKPKSRTRIFLAKLCANLCSMLIVEIAFYSAAAVFFISVQKNEEGLLSFTLICLTFSLIQIIYMSLGMLIGVIITKIKSIISITMGIVLTTFFIGMLGSIVDKEILTWFSPLKYFDSNYIMMNNFYETKYLVLSIVIPIALLVGAYIIYTKKDVPSV